MAGRKCSVCAHPNIEDINAALKEGTTSLRISARWKIPNTSVRRHRDSGHAGDVPIPAYSGIPAEINPAETDASDLAGSRAHAAAVLIPQPHGGALAPPRRVLIPAARTSWNEAKRQAAEIAATSAPDVLTEMARLSTKSLDERVRVVAGKEVMAAAKDAFAMPDGPAEIDLSRLTADQMDELEFALEVVSRMRALATVPTGV